MTCTFIKNGKWKRKDKIMKNIGIPVSTSKTQYYINFAYADYISEAGLIPIFITPSMDIEAVMPILSGIVLPGGIDIDPIYYGDDNYSSMGSDPEKDEFERQLFYAALKRNLPVFGICRGLQLIVNEYLLNNAWSLQLLDFYTHINEHNQVNDQQLERGNRQHFVNYFHNLLYSTDQKDTEKVRMAVNSMHHQCLVLAKKNAEALSKQGFVVSAWTTRGAEKVSNKKEDKEYVVCEGIAVRNFNNEFKNTKIMAVQWHPEELGDVDLIKNFFTKNTQAVNG